MPFNLASGAEGDRPVVDVRVLEELVGSEPEVIADFLAQYRASARSLGADLRAARDAGDLAAIAGAAHKLKSASRAIGALALGDLSAAIEQAARAQQSEAVRSLLPSFDLAFASVERTIAQHLAAS